MDKGGKMARLGMGEEDCSVFLLLGCFPLSVCIKPKPWEQDEIREGKCEDCDCLIWVSKFKRETKAERPDTSSIVCFECAFEYEYLKEDF